MSSKIRIKFYRRTDVKMTLWYILTFFLSVLAIGGFLYVRMKHQLIKEVDRFLLDETRELETVLTRIPKDDPLKDFEKHVEARTYYPIYFRILDENGKSFYISGNLKGMRNHLNERVLINAQRNKETRENRIFISRKEEGHFDSSAPLFFGRETVLYYPNGYPPQICKEEPFQF